jgi:integrase/recombinase XerD
MYDICTMALTLYRRHSSDCANRDDRYYKRCTCAMWVGGTLERISIRRAMHTQSWERAAAIVGEWEKAGKVQEKAKPTTIEQAIRAYLIEGKVNELSEVTLTNYARWTGRFARWCESVNIKYIEELTKEELKRYLAHTSHLSSGSKRLLRVQMRTWLKFCRTEHPGWIEDGLETTLKKIKGKSPTPEPYDDAEIEALLAHIKQDDLRALVLLLLHSGFRILDAITLPRARIDAAGNLAIRTHKTGHDVRLPLHPDALAAINALPTQADGLIFMALGERPDTARERYRNQLRIAWKSAGGKGRVFFHRFRHTFACRLLGAGVPIGDVSKLLGHASQATAERFYASWIKERQDRLDLAVRAAWKL